MFALREIFEIMREYYKNRPEQEWWPEDPLEVIVGAILVPGTSWPIVARVLDELKKKGLLDFQQLLTIDLSVLEEIVRPVGFQQRKAPTIKETIRFLDEQCQGNLVVYFRRDPEIIRSELLKLGGIGPKTADNILLYAGNQRIYSVDKHTIRIFLRHGIIGERTKEAAVKELIAESFDGVEEDVVDSYNEFQALLTRISRDFCSKTNPDCRTCPLQSALPENGPLHCHFESVSQKRLRERPILLPQMVETRPVEKRLVETQPVHVQPVAIKPSVIKPIEELELSDLERKVLELVSPVGTPIDRVIQQSGLSTGQVLATLSALEMRRLVRRQEGNNVVRI